MKGAKQNNKSKPEGNVYDRIFKENAESLFLPIIQQELNLRIKSYSRLPDKLPKTVEREVDFLYEIELENNETWILHIEFQTNDAKNMIYRMGMYHGLVWEKYKKPIKHIVIYLGKGKAKMRQVLTEEELFKGFDVINLHQLDTDQLLSSQVPEVIMLALLSNYKKERSERILRLIIERILHVSKSDKLNSKFVTQLIILSKLRNLENQTIKILENMPVLIDIETSILYQRGVNKGIDKGIDKGIEKEKEAVVIRGLDNGMTFEQIAIITELTIDQIKKIEAEHKS